MALKPCKECRKDVAVGAAACPNCGTAWPAGRKTSPAALGCLGLIVLLAVFALFQPGADRPSAIRTTPVPDSQAPLPRLPISRSQLATLFPEVAFESRTLANGQEAFSGRGKVTLLEALGPAEALGQIFLLAGVAKGNTATAAAALRDGVLLIKATAPGDQGCIDWYLAALKRITDAEQFTRCGHVRVGVKRSALGISTTIGALP